MKFLKSLLYILSIIVPAVMIVVAASTAMMSLHNEDFFARMSDAGNKTQKCTLQLETTAGGKLNYQSGTYKSGDLITLAATAQKGYAFAGWYGADNMLISTAPKLSFTVNHNISIRAAFTPVTPSTGDNNTPEVSTPSGGNGENNTGSTGTPATSNDTGFRDIYQNYNAANATMTEHIFQNSLNNLLDTEDEKAKELVSTIISSYTSNLFQQIESSKSKEDENGTQEALFMEIEPAAFDALYGHMTNILQDGENYRPEEHEIIHMLECVTKSDSCIATIETIAETAIENTVLMDSVSNMPEEVQETITNALSSYHQAAEIESKNQEICEQIAKLLGITLSDNNNGAAGDINIPDDIVIPDDIKLPA